MKLAVFINTPAQVHFYKNLISEMTKDGHEIQVLARDYQGTENLLDEIGIEYDRFASRLESKSSKMFGFPLHVADACRKMRRREPDVILGFGMYSAYAGALTRRPSIVFTDTEHTPLQFLLSLPFTSAVITPSCFKRNLGKKHTKVDSFKELAYLHPNHFRPDERVLDMMGLDSSDDFSILRFNGFHAMHDLTVEGFTDSHKKDLARLLSKEGRVFISSELSLPADLREYALNIPKSMLHHALYYAKLVVADTGTVVTESAVLGTPVIRFNAYSGGQAIGNFIELENRYGLVKNVTNPDEVERIAESMITRSDLKSEWRTKASQMISEKLDLTDFMAGFIEDFIGNGQAVKPSMAERPR